MSSGPASPDSAPFDAYLQALIAAVADGCSVDWSDAEAHATNADERRMLRQLRALSDIAAESPSVDSSESSRGPHRPDGLDAPALRTLGDGRFLIERCLGRGGFGIVYQAYDQQGRMDVALKWFARPGVESVYDFKKEFRVLADLSHHNLVSLYELFADADSWFIAMELVPGVDFLTFVREPGVADSESAHDVPRPTPGACDMARLGHAMTQLSHALTYLHGAGKLHCDIKPSNVLITPGGHLKLVDFGLATDAFPGLIDDTVRIRGTPAYVAPERAAGGRPTEASDWYGVGVMLFEALTGERPFDGTVGEVLEAKQRQPAPAPARLRGGVPESLNTLCRQLLERDPNARPGGSDVLLTLRHIWPDAGITTESPRTRVEQGPFVGRQPQLAVLDRAFELSRLGRAQSVFLHGASGMGKTSLVRHFLDQLRERGTDAVILEGRCYERESVPYKALDSLVDQLSHYLKRLPRAQADAVLPRDGIALARLFPVLHRVEAMGELRQRPIQTTDVHELRRRGWAAFRDLLARVVDRHPLVMVIDDLQWTDADSAALINELIFGDDASPLLFIGCYRTEEAASNTALAGLLADADTARRTGRSAVQTAAVGELSIPEAYELTLALEQKHQTGASVDAIVRESGQSPFFINQLIHYSATMAPTPSPDATEGDRGALDLTLDAVIRDRAASLGEGARRLLKVLAVFAGPMELAMAGEAAGLGPAALDDSMALRAARLARSRIAGSDVKIEVYHDRIREAIAAAIPAEQCRQLHARLAGLLAQSPGADPDALVHHFQGAGQPGVAATYAVIAGDRAREALAFDRAVRAYRFALEFGEFADAGRSVRIRLGDALAAVGRGYEASQAYLTAADTVGAGDALELKRRAAEQLLRSGYLDEGLRVVGDVLRRVGLRLATSPRRALLSLLLLRARIAVRGLRFTERDESSIPSSALVRVDTSWSVTTGLAIVDHIRSAEFGARNLLLALETGEPLRIVRALAMELAYTSIAGASSQPQNEKLIRIAEDIAERVHNPEARAIVTLAKGSAAYMQGQWRAAHDLCERAERILRERCTGVAWQMDTAQFYTLLSLFYLGDVAELSGRLVVLLKEARERDALYAETNLRTRLAYLTLLASDDTAGAEREVREGMERWSQRGFHNQHYYEMVATCDILLYAGDGATAWTRVVSRWRDLRRTLLLRVQPVLIESTHLRARAAVAAALDPATAPRERGRLLTVAEQDGRRLRRMDAPWGHGLAELTLGGVSTLRGDWRRAVTHLGQAEDIFERVHMGLYAAVARRRRGELTATPTGDEAVQSADDWMRGQRIAEPARFAQMLAPGAFDRAPRVVTRAPATHGAAHLNLDAR